MTKRIEQGQIDTYLNTRLDFDGSKIASSLPVTMYPLLCNASAKLCIAAPPMAMKCVLIFLVVGCRLSVLLNLDS